MAIHATFTVYFCGNNPDHAISGMVFDNEDSAKDYADDNDMNVYEASVSVEAWELSLTTDQA